MILSDVSSYLSVTVLYEDLDMQEIEVQACNGTFAGTAALYVSYGELAALAKQLEGFPKTITQEEVVRFADYGLTHLIQMTFQCVGGVGYAAVKVVLESGNQRVEMGVGFSPSEMDDFCRQLASVAEGKYRQAVLGTTS
jgi:hypothetical protein